MRRMRLHLDKCGPCQHTLSPGLTYLIQPLWGKQHKLLWACSWSSSAGGMSHHLLNRTHHSKEMMLKGDVLSYCITLGNILSGHFVGYWPNNKHWFLFCDERSLWPPPPPPNRHTLTHTKHIYCCGHYGNMKKAQTQKQICLVPIWWHRCNKGKRPARALVATRSGLGQLFWAPACPAPATNEMWQTHGPAGTGSQPLNKHTGRCGRATPVPTADHTKCVHSPLDAQRKSKSSLLHRSAWNGANDSDLPKPHQTQKTTRNYTIIVGGGCVGRLIKAKNANVHSREQTSVFSLFFFLCCLCCLFFFFLCCPFFPNCY